MKQILLLVGIFTLVSFSLHFTGESKEISKQGPLVDIVELMDSNQIEVDEWRLYSRGEIQQAGNKSEYVKKVHQLMKQHEQFDFQKMDEGEHWKVFGSNVHKTLPFVEELTILAYPKKAGYAVYLVYEVHGTSWSQENWSQIAPIFQKQISDLYPTPSPIFTTVTGHSDDIRQDDLYETATRYMTQLSGETIESLNEETFVSLSAYNGKWNGAITTNGRKMNVQTALRSSGLGGRTTVTIGTPIITTEY